ncbi:MAG: metallophosphoesterase [Campylobacterota bacterium]|nr:metallophosphoesterase [Campylobacterota bacterium]
MFARYNPNIPNWLYFILSLPIGVVFLVFCTAVVYDLSHLAITKIPLNNKRRNFFKKGLDYSSLVVALGLTSRSVYEAKHIELETVDIKLKNLKQPYKIVQLSDIHIGGLIDQKFIKNLVDRVNTLEPDLVVITGDLVDVALKYAKPSLDELTKLKSVYGTYFIVGNHEYFHNIEEIIKVMKQLEITVLENNYSYIGEQNKGFNLAGVYDVMGYRVGHHQPDIEKALKGVDKNSPVVLLAHQPRFIEEVDDSIDLVLSGHTHGGQIYPFRILVKLVQPYIAGLYNHSKHTQIYVNKGTGFWGPPMRLGSSSEITLINIS